MQTTKSGASERQMNSPSEPSMLAQQLSYQQCKNELNRLHNLGNKFTFEDGLRLTFVMARWQILNPQLHNSAVI